MRLCGPTSARRLARAPILPINRCARNTAADKKAANAHSPVPCHFSSLFLTLSRDRTVFGCAGHRLSISFIGESPLDRRRPSLDTALPSRTPLPTYLPFTLSVSLFLILITFPSVILSSSTVRAFVSYQSFAWNKLVFTENYVFRINAVFPIAIEKLFLRNYCEYERNYRKLGMNFTINEVSF